MAISQYPAELRENHRRKRNCLPEIATGAKRPRNDKSENLAPLNLCHDHCRSAWRSLSAATDAIGSYVLIGSLCKL